MISVWTAEVPEEEGLYWHYGTRYCQNEGDPVPEMNLVEVHRCANGFLYFVRGDIISPGHDGALVGVWKKAVLPDPPARWEFDYAGFYWCNNPECSRYHKHWEREWMLKQKFNGSEFICLYCGEKLAPVRGTLES